MTIRFRRRPDQWRSPHERARALAAERIDQPIDASEEAWLEGHLGGCPSCAAVAAAYAAQRDELRAMRRQSPEPPRDLWARTAAAIEHEAAAPGVARGVGPRRVRPSPIPLGAISGLLVIAVVVGASLLSRPAPRPAPAAGPTTAAVSLAPSRSPLAGPTPFDVAAGSVSWLRLGADGHVDIYDSQVNRVCPGKQGVECPPIDEPTPKSIVVPDPPASVSRNPKNEGLVVVDSATKRDGGAVYVLPATSATPGQSSAASPSPSDAAPSATPEPASPPPSAPPTTEPTALPTTEPSASATPPPTTPISPSPTVGVTASPAGGTIKIADDVIVVGESEAYSADGAWFAFSARPADGSHGPDIYAWRPGDAKARAVTTDHRSIFAMWLEGRILGSRGVVTTEPRRLRPEAFLIDPATGRQTALAVPGVWRPSVDPQRLLAVYWDGSLELNEAGTELLPADGRLVLGWWAPTTADAAPSPSASPEAASPAASPAASADAVPPLPNDSQEPSSSATGTPPASPAAGDGGPQAASSPATGRAIEPIEPIELVSGRVRDWDARWDETGTHLAVWIATADDPGIGNLTLYAVDPSTGRLQTLTQVAALAGFSIGKGRLAWATPPGQDGKGSRVQVVAWTKDSVGSIESRQSGEVLVVVR